MRILDWRDRSEPKDPIRLIDAGAVVRLDAVEIELHDPRRCQLAAHDRRLNLVNRRFFDPEFRGLRRGQRRGEQDE